MKQKSLKANFIWNMALTVSSFVFPLITFPYISRILLPEGTGKVNFVTSVISYFTMFSQLGIPTYGIRVCAGVRDDREKLTQVAQELLIINLITSVLSYFVLALGLLYIPRLRDERTLFLIVSSTILLSAIGIEWLYKALEQYTYITARSVICKLIALIAMFLLVHEKSDYVVYGAISIFASSAAGILNFANAHKFIDLKPRKHYDLRRHLRPVGTFFAMACAATVYTNLDTVMLGFMTTDTDVGYYSAAVKVKMILVSAVTALGEVLLPRASYYVENRQMEEFHRITKKALSFVFLFAVPLSVYFILYAREGVLFLSGPAYEGSVLPMQIIMPTVLLIGITNVLGMQILVPTGREKTVLYSEIAGAVTDIILNALLIPRLQSAGAAIGTLVAEAAVLFVQAFSMRDETGELFGKISYLKIFVAILLGTVASLWVKGLGFGHFVKLVISACLFFGIYGLYLLLRKEELVLEIWHQVLGKIRRRSEAQ